MGSSEHSKRCPGCGLIKTAQAFSRHHSRPDGLDVHCRQCTSKRTASKRARNVAAGLCADCGAAREGSSSRRYCLGCAAFYSRRFTEQSRALRLAVLQAYGGANPHCACCGEAEIRFLTLDHQNGGGRADRRAKGTQGVLRQLRRDNFPSGLRVLCFNCNMVRGAHGMCPHEGDQAVLPGSLTAAECSTCPDARKCTRCRTDLPLSAFYPSNLGHGGIQSRCRDCTKAAAGQRLRAARRDALAHYSGGEIACKCCGEAEASFLALDHIDGEGPRRPDRRGGGNTFYAWLKKQGFPHGLQVLCHNCNCSKGRDRQGPHALAARKTA